MTALEEIIGKAKDFLAGRYGNLTTGEIAEFRAAQEDPDGTEWEREHAGEVFGMDTIDLNGFQFVEFPAEIPFGKCMDILRSMFGGHPITPARLWWIARHKLIDKEMEHER